MRIISGSARGTKLKASEGFSIRPTADRVKEALFSMLLPKLEGARVLDLFAGTGALGIEALSRGAAEAVLVDNSKEAISCITYNLEKTSLMHLAKVVRQDALDYLSAADGGFDIIFLDPPYNSNLIGEALKLIDRRNLLKRDGLAVLEWAENIAFPQIPESYENVKEKKYGRVRISILSLKKRN